MELVSAYKVNIDPMENPRPDRVVGIVYRDDYDRRCTMFVTTGTDQGVQVLIDLINGASQGSDL